MEPSCTHATAPTNLSKGNAQDSESAMPGTRAKNNRGALTPFPEIEDLAKPALKFLLSTPETSQSSEDCSTHLCTSGGSRWILELASTTSLATLPLQKRETRCLCTDTQSRRGRVSTLLKNFLQCSGPALGIHTFSSAMQASYMEFGGAL